MYENEFQVKDNNYILQKSLMIEKSSSPINKKNDRFSQSTNESEEPYLVQRQNKGGHDFKKQQGCKKKELQVGESKLNKVMVGWIQMVGWTKDFSIEGILLAVSLMNSYKFSKKVEKSRIQLILSSCLLLSSKYLGKPIISLEEIYEITSGSFQMEEMIQMQGQILSVIDYNLNINSPFLFYLEKEERCGEEKQKLKFLLEMFLLHDSRIIDQQKQIQDIIRFGLGRQSNKKCELKKLIQIKQGKDLIQKYHSQFEVEGYLSKVLGEQ